MERLRKEEFPDVRKLRVRTTVHKGPTERGDHAQPTVLASPGVRSDTKYTDKPDAPTQQRTSTAAVTEGPKREDGKRTDAVDKTPGMRFVLSRYVASP